MKTNEKTTTYTDRNPIKVDEPVSRTGYAGGPKTTGPADNISRKNKIGVIISAAVLGIIAIALVTMFVLTM